MSDGDLRRVFRKHLAGVDFQAVETGATSSGVPDLNYAIEGGIEGWVEMKACDHWRVSIRPMQVGWCERRLRFNPRVFCAVRRGRTELWFYHGSAMRKLKDERLDMVVPMGVWEGGPTRWGWNDIRLWLAGG